jgi:hypothetical protein
MMAALARQALLDRRVLRVGADPSADDATMTFEF